MSSSYHSMIDDLDEAAPEQRVEGGNMNIDRLVDRFLAWPLPDSVCSDVCATKQGYPHRSGTTLLSAIEAKHMLEYVLAELLNDHAAALRQQVERITAERDEYKRACSQSQDELFKLQATLERVEGERNEAFGYLARLFAVLAPQCACLGTLLGVCTQIDNAIAGLKTELAQAEQDKERLRAVLESIAGNTYCGPCQEAKLVAQQELKKLSASCQNRSLHGETPRPE